MATPPEFPPETSVAPDAARFPVWLALAVFIAGVIGGVVGFSIGLAITGDESLKLSDQSALTTFCGFAGQFGVITAGLFLASRFHGSGSWRRDYGLTLRVTDAWAVFVGLALQVVFLFMLLPFQNLIEDKQGVVEDIQSASGAKLAVIAVFAGLVAPLVEELLFRGLLLHALLVRVSPAVAIAISGIAFGVVHVLLDPSAGTLLITPFLIVMGVVSGIMAVRSGDLSQSILFHVGFNLLTVVDAIVR